jgi:hypothetical protein
MTLFPEEFLKKYVVQHNFQQTDSTSNFKRPLHKANATQLLAK